MNAAGGGSAGGMPEGGRTERGAAAGARGARQRRRRVAASVGRRGAAAARYCGDGWPPRSGGVRVPTARGRTVGKPVARDQREAGGATGAATGYGTARPTGCHCARGGVTGGRAWPGASQTGCCGWRGRGPPSAGRCGSARRMDAPPRRVAAGGCHAPTAIPPLSREVAAARLAAHHGRARPPLVSWRPCGSFGWCCPPATAAVGAGICWSAAPAAAMTRTVWACCLGTRGLPRAASYVSCATTPCRGFFPPPLSSKRREYPTPRKPHCRQGLRSHARFACFDSLSACRHPVRPRTHHRVRIHPTQVGSPHTPHPPCQPPHTTQRGQPPP